MTIPERDGAVLVGPGACPAVTVVPVGRQPSGPPGDLGPPVGTASLDLADTRWRRGPILAWFWLAYLFDALRTAWQHPGLPVRLLGVGAVVGFGVLYAWSWVGIRRWRRADGAVPPAMRAVILGGGFGLFLLATPAAGESALDILIFLTVLAMFALPPRWAVLSAAATVALVEVSSRTVPGWQPRDQLGLQVVAVAVAMWGVTQVMVRNRELAVAHQQLASLAVAQERTRFARDLHDVLGHSLTVLTVKAELAGRLIRLDPARAEREVAEVEQLARQALADVRTAVAGYRETSLPSELVSARVALDAAGIEAELPNAVDDVPGERRELAGWTLREGVTNVVRHSGARHCRVRVDRHGIEISDDGRGPASSGAGASGPESTRIVGHGLAGLRARAHKAGAAVAVARSPEGGFVLRVTW